MTPVRGSSYCNVPLRQLATTGKVVFREEFPLVLADVSIAGLRLVLTDDVSGDERPPDPFEMFSLLPPPMPVIFNPRW